MRGIAQPYDTRSFTSLASPSGQDRIMIYGPKTDGTYIVEFRDGESGWRDHVLKHFQARMPYGLVRPDVP
jgi:hypothetical protein